MANDVFYVYPQKGRDAYGDIIPDKTATIAAKFLIINGQPVIDPNPPSKIGIHLYRRLDAHGKIDESSKFANTHNYLIVPVNYDPSEAAGFAASVDIGMAGTSALTGPRPACCVERDPQGNTLKYFLMALQS